jgi:hypothetical protein
VEVVDHGFDVQFVVEDDGVSILLPVVPVQLEAVVLRLFPE